MANKGCGSALKEAEQEESSPASSEDDENKGIAEHADKLPVLPEGDEGTKLLESGGPEAKSAPVE